MKKSNIKAREKAVRAAIGSVRAEGLEPSVKIQHDLYAFARNKTTIEVVRRKTIARIAKSIHAAQ